MEKFDVKYFHMHPAFLRYSTDGCGHIFDSFKKRILDEQITRNGYNQIIVYVRPKYIYYYVDRFVYECFNDIIPDGKMIRHIDGDVANDNIDNLECIDGQDTRTNIDFSFVKDNHKNVKLVKSVCIETGDVDYFHSLYSVQKELDINSGLVKMCCEGKNYIKQGKSKVNGNTYTFEYINELPEGYTRDGKLDDKAKKQKIKDYVSKYSKKRWTCENCNKEMTMGSRYLHRKKCLLE